MAYFYRLIIVALLFAFSSLSFAVVPPGPRLYRYDSSSGASSYIYSSSSAACAAYIVLLGDTVTTYTLDSQSSGGCWVKSVRNSDGYTSGSYAQLQSVISCPANSSLVGGSSCICNPTFFENETSTACIKLLDPDDPDPGSPTPEQQKKIDNDQCKVLETSSTSTPRERYKGYISGGSQLCLPSLGVSDKRGCMYTFELEIASGNPYVSQGTTTVSKGATNKSCDISTDKSVSPDKLTDKSCPVNQQMGKFNGVSVCMPVDRSVPTKTETVKTTEGTDANGNPKKTTENTTTTCVDGKCSTVTTTTTTTNNNTTTDTTTKEGSKSGYCTENPKSVQCGNGDGESSFFGACGADFVCKGDALLCAISSEQHQRDCELFVNKSPESDLYEKAKALDSTQSVTKDLTKDVDISPSKFDSSNILGGGACIPDKNIIIMSKSYSLPFSKVCPYLEYMGSILLMVSFALAARIVARG